MCNLCWFCVVCSLLNPTDDFGLVSISIVDTSLEKIGFWGGVFFNLDELYCVTVARVVFGVCVCVCVAFQQALNCSLTRLVHTHWARGLMPCLIRLKYNGGCVLVFRRCFILALLTYVIYNIFPIGVSMCVCVCVCVWQDHTDSIESVMLNQLFNFKMQNDAALVLVISNGRVCVCMCVYDGWWRRWQDALGNHRQQSSARSVIGFS